MKKLLFLFCVFILNSNIFAQKPIAKTRLTAVFFPKDADIWTGQILSGFYSKVLGVQKSLSISAVAYQFGLTQDEELIKNVVLTKPDYVFLPDDFLYVGGKDLPS